MHSEFNSRHRALLTRQDLYYCSSWIDNAKISAKFKNYKVCLTTFHREITHCKYYILLNTYIYSFINPNENFSFRFSFKSVHLFINKEYSLIHSNEYIHGRIIAFTHSSLFSENFRINQNRVMISPFLPLTRFDSNLLSHYLFYFNW